MCVVAASDHDGQRGQTGASWSAEAASGRRVAVSPAAGEDPDARGDRLELTWRRRSASETIWRTRQG